MPPAHRLPVSPLRLLGVCLVAALAAACEPPSDVIFQQPEQGAVEVEPGLFRLTFNTGPDDVRGFSADGSRIIYRSRGPEADVPWVMHSIGLEGGRAREEAALYVAAINDAAGQLTVLGERRVLVGWRPSIPGAPGCPAPCPAEPSVWGLTVIGLEAEDGAALSSLPIRAFMLPNVVGAFSDSPLLRRNPAELEHVERGSNPFGPAMLPGDTAGVLSDGEVLWRFSLVTPDAPRDSIGPGAFPTLSPDGRLLAAAVPTGVTTSSEQCQVLRGLGACTQEVRTERPLGWEIVLYDLAADSASVLTEGLEPIFDPSQPDHLLIRRFDGLHWFDLEAGTSSLIDGTAGAAAVALGPDGTIAFSLQLSGNRDVFFVAP